MGTPDAGELIRQGEEHLRYLLETAEKYGTLRSPGVPSRLVQLIGAWEVTLAIQRWEEAEDGLWPFNQWLIDQQAQDPANS